MAHDVFISHSTSNRPVANAVCAALESIGIRCWIAPRDVLPGRSYSGEITRAIQQSRAFVLIFSEHSNNSEQVLREVQLAANSRLHIVQFRIDAVAPSDDLEYYLSGPHWLDAVTPPLEGHLDQLKSSMKALLALPRAAPPDQPAPASPPSIRPPPPEQDLPSRPTPPAMAAQASANPWKLVALVIGVIAALGCVAFVILFALFQPKPPSAPAPPHDLAAPSQTPAVLRPPANADSSPAPRTPGAPASTSPVLSTTEAERYAKDFYRDMERGDLNKTISYLDETVDYYAFGPKDKAFIGEQMRQYFAGFPLRTFVVNDVTVQDSARPSVATLIFDVRYSARDIFGVPSSGHTRVEWDVAKRNDGLKIVRSNWITYPDASPSR
jgi:hypothetical protein